MNAGFRACCSTCSGDVFPSSPRRGVCAIKKKLRSILIRADGVVINHQPNLLEFPHHPVRSIKEASRYFVEVAATPPRRGGENCGPLRFGSNPLLARVQIQTKIVLVVERGLERAVAETQRSAIFPSSPRRSGRDLNKYREASFMERTGWCSNSTEFC